MPETNDQEKQMKLHRIEQCKRAKAKAEKERYKAFPKPKEAPRAGASARAGCCRRQGQGGEDRRRPNVRRENERSSCACFRVCGGRAA